MTSRTSEITAAKTLAQSAAVNDAIQTIIAELVEAQSGLVGARPAVDDLKQSYEDALAKYGELRGRPALYPYIGSGIGNGPLVELADGSVKPVIHGTFPLAEAAAAHALMESSAHIGKIVLTVDGT